MRHLKISQAVIKPAREEGDMKFKSNISTKSLQINKNQSTILMVVAIATIISVFCLTSAKVLLNQALYQRRVINARNASAKQLDADVNDAKTLSDQYKVFLGSDSENIIGGNSNAGDNAAPPDGDNGKIVLDALPTTYDFPALLTSLSNLLASDGVGAQTIGGSDQATTINSAPAYHPQTANIDLTISGASTYNGAQRLLTDLERSIRPFDVTHLAFGGDESNLTISLNLTTYYQPAKTLSVPSKEIK
ncbi:hypothetical protein KW794_01775 [Candidatus Saccharibacteria bacterium]|nr:hypothetical protein [Candidatus Saccharibacteria bacterium]